MFLERDVVGISRHEQNSRHVRPDHAFGGYGADVAGEAHRRPGLDREPALGRGIRTERTFRDLERQQRELGRRERQPKMNEQSGLTGIDRQTAGKARNRAEDAAHVDADVVQHGETIARIAGLVAQLLQLSLERCVFVRNRHDAGARVATHREVLRERRQQLVLRWPGAQELDVDEANLDVVSHGHFLQWDPRRVDQTIAYRLPKRQHMQMALSRSLVGQYRINRPSWIRGPGKMSSVCYRAPFGCATTRRFGPSSIGSRRTAFAVPSASLRSTCSTSEARRFQGSKRSRYWISPWRYPRMPSFRECTASLAGLGYEYAYWVDLENDFTFEKGIERTHHVHLVELDSRQWSDYLRFRDVLRQNAQLLREYERVKIELGARFCRDRASYTREKAEFICRVLSMT